MADYKDIKGGAVQNFAGDPPAPIVGQLWYDSTASKFEFFSSNPVGAWASGGTMNTARSGLTGSTGTQTAAIGFGGQTPPNTYVAVTETYDGSSWTEVGDLNTARQYPAGVGTATAALSAGGGTSGPDNYYAVVEKWNGTAWTEVADLSAASGYGVGTAGTTAAALAFGGRNPTHLATSEEWNEPATATEVITTS